jgi:hypothetical protein
VDAHSAVEAVALSEVAQLPRRLGDGTGDATTVITIFSLVFAIALFGVAIGLHTAQSWLERRTYQRHVGD